MRPGSPGPAPTIETLTRSPTGGPRHGPPDPPALRAPRRSRSARRPAARSRRPQALEQSRPRVVRTAVDAEPADLRRERAAPGRRVRTQSPRPQLPANLSDRLREHGVVGGKQSLDLLPDRTSECGAGAPGRDG